MVQAFCFSKSFWDKYSFIQIFMIFSFSQNSSWSPTFENNGQHILKKGIRKTWARLTKTQQNQSSNYQPPSFTSGLYKTRLEIWVETEEYHQSKALAWVSFQSFMGGRGERASPPTAANQVSEAPRKPKTEIRRALQEGKTVLPSLINVYCAMECGPWSSVGLWEKHSWEGLASMPWSLGMYTDPEDTAGFLWKELWKLRHWSPSNSEEGSVGGLPVLARGTWQ